MTTVMLAMCVVTGKPASAVALTRKPTLQQATRHTKWEQAADGMDDGGRWQPTLMLLAATAWPVATSDRVA